MPYSYEPVDYIPEPLPAGAAPPANDTITIPDIGVKNIYKNGQAQPGTSDETINIPSAAELNLPKVVIGGKEPAAPAKKYSYEPVDYIPPRASEVYDPASDYAVTRGIKTNFNAAGQANSHALALPAQMAMNDADLAKALLAEAAQGADPRNPSLQVSGASKIEGVGDFLTWLGESLGGTVGSFAGAATYGGLPGAALGAGIGAAGGSVLPGPGTLAGGVAGAATGFTTGSAANFVMQGIDGMKQEMLQEPEVLKGLQDGTINPKQLLTIIMGAGTLIGAIDAVPAGKFLAQIGGKQVGKDVVRELLKKAAAKGAAKGFAEEGGTETLQGTISEVTKAVESGDWDVVNRGLSVLDQGLAGGVGGASFGAAGAVRDQQKLVAPVGQLYRQAAAEKAAAGGESNEALPAGTLAPDPADAVAAGNNSPGNVGANQPAQPAGSAATAKTEVTTPDDGVDPTLKAATGALGGEAGAGPVAKPTDQPVINQIPDEDEEDVGPPPAPDDPAAAELARLTREQVARQQQEDTARAQEKAAAAPTIETGDIAKDVAAALDAKQQQNTSKKTPRVRTPKVDAAAVETPVVDSGVTGENLGTGVNLAQTPAVTEPTPAAPPVPTPAAGESPAAQPLQGNEPTVSGAAAPAPAPNLAGQVAALTPAETPAVVDAPPPDWMVENNKNAVTLAEALGVTDMIKGMAERGLTAKTISTALGGKLDPDQVRAVRDHLGIAAAGPKTFAGVEIPSAPAPVPGAKAEIIRGISKAKEEPVAKAPEPVKTEPAKAAAPAKPAAPLTREEQVKQRIAQRKKLTTVVAPKATGGVVAERVAEVEAPERQPEAPSPPAAAPEAAAAKPARSEASRHAADLADRSPTLQRSTVSELMEYRDTLHDVAAEVVTRKRREQPGLSVAEAARASAAEIAETVKQRLSKQQEEFDERSVAAEEAVSTMKTAAKAEAAKEVSAKREEQAKATAPQKKERAKASGMSAEGIKVQSDKSVLSEEKLQLKKDPADRDQLVMRHAQLVREKSNKDTTPERLKEIAELEATLKDLRIAQAEAKAEAPKGPSDRAKKAERQVKEATRNIQLPDIPPKATEDVQTAIAVGHLRAFYNAIKGLNLAGRHDRNANSELENLAIFAKKLMGKKADVAGYGGGEFWQAHYLIGNDDIEAFNNLVTNEKIKGAQLREETTGDDAEVGDVDRVDYGETVDRTRRQEEGEAPDPLFLRKGGREGAVARAVGQSTRDARKSTGFGTATTYGPDGKPITVEAQTATASQRLRQVKDTDGIGEGFAEAARIVEDRGFFSLFRNMHRRRLMQLVGDTPVHIISVEDMERIVGKRGGVLPPAGVFMPGWGEHNPAVFITDEAAADLTGAPYEHVLLHELTHAATVSAYDHNIRGTRQIIDRMRVALLKDLRRRGFTDAQLDASGVSYGLLTQGRGKDMTGLEFIAEAFSNPDFQDLLSQLIVPRSIQRDIAAIAGGRQLSWWSAFTGAVSNAIGMIRGQRGNTYMEQMVALHPHLMQSSAAQFKQSWEAHDRGVLDSLGGMEGLPRARPRGPSDAIMFRAEFNQLADGVKDWATNGTWSVKRQQLANALSTLGQLQRKAAEYFGGTDNPFQKLSDILLRKDPLRMRYRKMGEAIEVELGKLATDKATTAKLSKNLHEASRFGVNHMEPLSHASNSHISKKGPTSHGRREAHARLAAEFATFSPAVQKVARDAAAHYRKAWEMETKATVTYIVKAALKTYRARGNLPAGKTEQDVVDWVLDKGPLRKEDERTPLDKEFREALGNTADRLADITEARALKGLYFPLARRGKWFVTALEKLTTPAGAIADPTSPDGNRFLFTDEAKARDYTGSSDMVTKLTSRYVDPATGLKVKTKEGVYINDAGQVVIPVRQFVVTVQNKHMIMHDNKNTLLRDRKALADAGHQVSAVGLTRQMLEENTHQDITPAQITTLLKHTEQTAIGSNTIGQQAVQDAIRESAIRAMTRPSALTKHLKRTGQMGYDLDLTSAMREHNRAWASHMSNMELAHEMSDHQAALDKYINDRRRTNSGDDIEQLQLLKSELMKRFKDLGKPAETTTLSRFADQVMNVSFMRHLFSPHYTIINLMQPIMTTYPILAGKYGDAAVWSETIRFYKMGGVSRALKTGFNETWNASRSLVGYGSDAITQAQLDGMGVQDKIWFDITKNEADAAELHAMYHYGIDRGFGAAAGIEAAAVSEEEMNAVEKGLTRVSTVAKGLPEAAESINRYHAATVSYRLARRAGMSVADAQREAWSTVEQTQGGYARANSPRMFNNPLLRAPLQFKKYGVMYAQMFYGNLTKLIAPSSDPAARKLAAKTLARLSLTTVAFAGLGGLPMVEIARMLANVAVMMGLSDDDWDDDENAIQDWFSQLIGGTASEALVHGATRLAGVDTSSALGADSLFTFGQPKHLEDEDSVKAWMTNMMLGASGQMAFDTITAISEGDIYGAFPWPKFMDSMRDAIGLYTEGTVSKTTGEQYAKPVGIGEAIVKGLGFNPASSARQWETGGTGRAQKEKNQVSGARKTIMGRWAAARQRGNSAEAQRIFREDVAEWNRSHKGKERIDMSGLMHSMKERERNRRELEKSLKK